MRTWDDEAADAVEALLREQREDADRAVQGCEMPGEYESFVCAPEGGLRPATPAEVRALVEALDDVVGRGADLSAVAFCVGLLLGAVLGGLAALVVP